MFHDRMTILNRRIYGSLSKHWDLFAHVRTGSSGVDDQAQSSAMKMTTESSTGGSEMTMDDVKNLIKKKDEIEEQIKAYYDVLEDVSLFVNTQFNNGNSM